MTTKDMSEYDLEEGGEGDHGKETTTTTINHPAAVAVYDHVPNKIQQRSLI
jgi:hypothetical protein